MTLDRPQLDEDQRHLFELMNLHKAPPRPSGDQTPEQARSFAVWQFGHACMLQGLDDPPRAAVLAALPE